MSNYNGKQFVMCLFIFDLLIEKLITAHWVKDNLLNTPPCSHDLKYILNETNRELEPKLHDFLFIVNDWNIPKRYPDYKMKLNKMANVAYMKNQLTIVTALRTCLLEKL